MDIFRYASIPGKPGIILLLAGMLFFTTSNVKAGGCTGSNFSYTIDSINYCSNTVCITFSGYATGLHGNETFCWNWGDGSPQDCDVPGLNGNQSYTRSACKTYNLASTYTVSLNVTPSHTSCLVSRDLVFQNTDYTVDVSCAGDQDGCIYFLPNPVTPDLTYTWSNGATTADVCGLSPGSYSITVTDVLGCVITETFSVGDAPPIAITVDSANCANGNAQITVTGGTPPTQSSNPFNENFNAFPDGASNSGPNQKWTSSNPSGGQWDRWQVMGGEWNGYSLDNEAVWETGCINVKYCTNNTFSIDLAKSCNDANSNDYFRVYYSCDGSPETQILNPVINQISNYPTYCTFTAPVPNCTGCLKIIVRTQRPHSGGTCNTSSVTSGPCATGSSSTTTTTTTNTSTGGGGQDQDDNRHEIFMDNININCTPTNPPPYTYLWCNGETTQDANNIPAGQSNCCVTVTDGNDCESVACASCCVLDLTTVKSNETCYGYSDGSAGVTIITGNAPYTYTWSNGATTAGISGLAGGTYTVSVSGSDGCLRLETFTIASTPQIVSTPSSSMATCGGTDGAGSIQVSGGVPGYTYLWSPGGYTTASVTAIPGGTYNVLITDSAGCTHTQQVVVPVSGNPPVADFDFQVTPECEGYRVRFINKSTNGATGYVWNLGNGDISGLSDPVAFYDYTQDPVIVKLIATKGGGCPDTLTDTISPGPLNLSYKVPNVFTPNNDGLNDCFSIAVSNMENCGELIVFNRWGIRIFDNRFGICWNGMTDTGVEAPEGTYYYLYKMRDRIDLHGWVSLVRDVQ